MTAVHLEQCMRTAITLIMLPCLRSSLYSFAETWAPRKVLNLQLGIDASSRARSSMHWDYHSKKAAAAGSVSMHAHTDGRSWIINLV